MSLSPLFEFQEWLPVDEAANELSTMTGGTVTETQVLRAGLNGHLALSVNLPPETVADCQQESVGSNHPKYISGIWDLPMIDTGRLYVENRLKELRGGLPIPLNERIGALVERPGERCRLRALPTSVVPAGSEIVVRTSAMNKFASKVAIDKPLDTKERATLLTIIAAFAKKADINVMKPYPAADEISALIDHELKLAVSASAIKDHLKLIPDALERKGKKF